MPGKGSRVSTVDRFCPSLNVQAIGFLTSVEWGHTLVGVGGGGVFFIFIFLLTSNTKRLFIIYLILYYCPTSFSLPFSLPLPLPHFEIYKHLELLNFQPSHNQ